MYETQKKLTQKKIQEKIKAKKELESVMQSLDEGIILIQNEKINF